MRDEIKNIRDVWQEGYDRLLQEARSRGSVSNPANRDEQRRHPRFPVACEDVDAGAEAGVRMRDMSISGLAFESRSADRTAPTITVALAKVFSTEVEVLACDPLPEDGADARRGYRVRCRFLDEEHGLQFLTLTLELERVERA